MPKPCTSTFGQNAHFLQCGNINYSAHILSNYCSPRRIRTPKNCFSYEYLTIFFIHFVGKKAYNMLKYCVFSTKMGQKVVSQRIISLFSMMLFIDLKKKIISNMNSCKLYYHIHSN